LIKQRDGRFTACHPGFSDRLPQEIPAEDLGSLFNALQIIFIPKKQENNL
jgi:hypothetical protein